jgi:hypothetical protein
MTTISTGPRTQPISEVSVPVSQRRGLFASSLAAACLLLTLNPGCDGAQLQDDVQLDGVASLALTAPDGVPSVKVTFKGPSRAVDRCVRVDGATATTLRGLPTGSIVVGAGAYTSNDCSGEPIWVAEDQTIQLPNGQPVAIQLVFHPNGTVRITARYVDDVPVLADDPNTPGDDRAGWIKCDDNVTCQNACYYTAAPTPGDVFVCTENRWVIGRAYCDGPEDCVQGEVCCPNSDYTHCATTCSLPRVCHTYQDCPTGQLCRANGMCSYGS